MIRVTIDTSNEVFDESYGSESARILRRLADKLEANETPIFIHDTNGNQVAKIEYEQD